MSATRLVSSMVTQLPHGEYCHEKLVLMTDGRMGEFSVTLAPGATVAGTRSVSMLWLFNEDKSKEILWECLTVFWSSGVRTLGTWGEFIIKRIAADQAHYQ